MSRTKPFSELRRKMPVTPERQERSIQRRRAMDVGLKLGKLQDDEWSTPDSQNDVFCIKHEEGVYLTTLRDAVEKLGGELEVCAVFPDRKVRLVPAEEE